MKKANLFTAAVLGVTTLLSGCAPEVKERVGFSCREYDSDTMKAEFNNRTAWVSTVNYGKGNVQTKVEFAKNVFIGNKEPFGAITGSYNPAAAKEVARTYCATGKFPTEATWSPTAP